jgi:hypothetical protein
MAAQSPTLSTPQGAPRHMAASMTPSTPARPQISLAELVDRVPEGWTLVSYQDRRYGLSRTTRANGKSISVLASELGGRDLVSANIYTTSAGHKLRACEMPEQKVLDFLTGWQPPRTSKPDPPSPGSDGRDVSTPPAK